MRLKKQRKFILLSTILAIPAAIFSNTFSYSLFSLTPPFLYALVLFLFKKKFMLKKKLISDSITTFSLVWFVLWTLLYNL